MRRGESPTNDCEQRLRVLLVDNYDSFTYNLYDYLAACDVDVEVVLNDDPAFAAGDLGAYDAIVISPGPGTPEHPRDTGIGGDVIRAATVPLLGVCLGHQNLCHVFGGAVTNAPEPYHGRTSDVWHDGDDLFAGIPSPFAAVRYHSLVVDRVPSSLRVIARTADGLPMALRHTDRPMWGVQFHPESIGTAYGRDLVANFVAIARAHRAEAPVRRVGAAPAPAERDGRPPASTMRVVVRRVESDLDAESVFHHIYGRSERAFWLDSSLADPVAAPFSFMGDDSGARARVATYDVARREVTVDSASGREVHRSTFLEWLRADLERIDVEVPELPFDFALGWVGLLGYELKSETGGELTHRAETPDAWMIFPERAIAVHCEEGALYLLALASPDDDRAACAWMDDIEAKLRDASPIAPLDAADVGALGSVRLRHDRDAYEERIRSCKREIHAGESYEICLTNMIEVDGTVDPWSAYRAVRRLHPVPFGAYLRGGDFSVLSCSPERMLRVGRDRVAESKPIKGTRPRSREPREDEALRRDLATSPKDRAENLMIVDLVRNDLARVAETGTVEVARLFDVETYSAAHQLVSTVRARLRHEVHVTDCVRAVFPGGSMTGAPKIRTMRIIDGLEGGARGVYSGSIGYFSLSGALDLSVVIRTLVVLPDGIRFGVGGAIIALSDDDEEFEETAVKAAALLSLVNQEFPGRAPLPVDVDVAVG